jgi:EmrB/QacA subfamily drug resistance transporter
MTTTATPTTAVTVASPEQRRWAALGVILLAAFMDIVDVSIVLIAAPSIQESFGTGYSAIQWVVAAYSLALGLSLITGGRLGDIYGRKRLFLTGVAGFVAASAACALAPGIGTLVAARAMQGVAAGLMIPQILASIQVTFPHHERPKAYGMYGAVNGLGAAAAPVLGGVLVGSDVLGLGWRSAFWINIPVGLFALVAGVVLLRESRGPRGARLDLVGVGLVSAALLLVLYPLVQGGELGWPVWTLLMLVAAVPAFGLFATHQARRGRTRLPLIPVSLFRSRSFTTGLVATMVVFSTISAIFLVLTIQLQRGHDYSPLRVGLVFLAWPVGLALSSGLAVRLAHRFGARLITAGTLLLAGAMLLLIGAIRRAGAELDWWELAPGLALGGLGFGLVAPIVVDTVLSTVAQQDAGAASGVTNTGIYVGIAAGIAVTGALFTAVLRESGDVDLAAQQSLWYAVAAFLAGFLLSFTLPAPRLRHRRARDA